jgi:hypothetical protein
MIPVRLREQLREGIIEFIDAWLGKYDPEEKFTGIDIEGILELVEIVYRNRYHKMRKEAKVNKYGEFK